MPHDDMNPTVAEFSVGDGNVMTVYAHHDLRGPGSVSLHVRGDDGLRIMLPMILLDDALKLRDAISRAERVLRERR